ncbi:MAG: proline iminopeptidase [Aequorivita sp.]|nr:MAG: proline iminopeptidase [Aequorivita sp.]
MNQILVILVALLSFFGNGLKAQNIPLQDGERFILVNGIKHWVKIKGGNNNTTPLIVVHGGPGGNHYSFERTIGPNLEAFATVIYYEQRGSGRSEAPKDSTDYTIPTLINDLDILRESLGLPKMNLLGYSFGAELSIRYAIEHPQSVEKLILSSPAEWSKTNMLVQIQGFYAIGDSITKKKIDTILQQNTPIEEKLSKIWNTSNINQVDSFLFVNPANAKTNRQFWNESKLTNTGLMAKVYLENAKGDLIVKASGLQIPTLLICGIYDKNGGLHTGSSLKQVLPQSILKLYENSAHFPDIEEPNRFAADVKSFLFNE